MGFTAKVGTTTNFIAELWNWDLREGLTIVKNCEFHKILIEIDSKSVLQIIKKESEYKPEADTLIISLVVEPL